MDLANWSRVIEEGAAATREEHERIRKEMGPPRQIFETPDGVLFGYYHVQEGVLRFRLNRKNEIIPPTARLFTEDELKAMMVTFRAFVIPIEDA